ncbi:uncharacterized protein LOC113474367 [Ciona intestinalis]
MLSSVPTSPNNATALPSPLQQVMQYKPNHGYVEINSYGAPFCGIVWCGFDVQTYQVLKVSIGSCLPISCRSGTYIIMAICGILAVVIVVANATVIVVFCRSRKPWSTQTVYKLSMAIADLLVGLFVFPASIVTIYLNIFGHRAFISTPTLNQTSCTGTDATNTLRSAVPSDYLSCVGFVTTVSISVSVYTLMLASYDRLLAIWKPIYHKNENTIRKSVIGICVVWIGCSLFGLLPIIVPGVGKYDIISGLLVGFVGSLALVLYGIAIAFPLLVVWLLIGATWFVAKQHNLKRRKMTSRRQNNKSREQKLNKVLLLMVGGFSASLLPVFVSILAAEMASGIAYSRPESLSLSSALAFTSFELVASIILMLNSLWNFFIYSARNEDFRKEAKRNYNGLADALGILKCIDFYNRCANNVNERRRSSAFSTRTMKTTSMSLPSDATRPSVS